MVRLGSPELPNYCSMLCLASMCYLLAFVVTLGAEFASRRPPQLQCDPDSNVYSVDVSALPHELSSTFVKSELDADTRAFLAASRSCATSPACRWILFVKHKIYVALISICGWTRVDASAFIGRAQMFVASSAQLGRALERAAPERLSAGMLDIGAGSGEVTSVLARALHITNPQQVFAIESSRPLRRELAHRWGYRAAASMEGHGTLFVGVAALLNVLDRVDDPQER